MCTFFYVYQPLHFAELSGIAFAIGWYYLIPLFCLGFAVLIKCNCICFSYRFGIAKKLCAEKTDGVKMDCFCNMVRCWCWWWCWRWCWCWCIRLYEFVLFCVYKSVNYHTVNESSLPTVHTKCMGNTIIPKESRVNWVHVSNTIRSMRTTMIRYPL